MSITTILNVYRRPEYIQEQVQAILDQTVQSKNIWIWQNEGDLPNGS